MSKFMDSKEIGSAICACTTFEQSFRLYVELREYHLTLENVLRMGASKTEHMEMIHESVVVRFIGYLCLLKRHLQQSKKFRTARKIQGLIDDTVTPWHTPGHIA